MRRAEFTPEGGLSSYLPLLVVFVATAVIFATAVSYPASASGATQFGSEGLGAGEFTGPRGIAIDQENQDVYIGDVGNARVDKFGPNGEFLLAWGWGVATGASEPQTCGPEGEAAACVAGVRGGGAGEFEQIGGLAVNDDVFSPTNGDIYVEDIAAHRVQMFTPNGHFAVMFGGDVNASNGENVCVSGEDCQAGTNGGGPGEFEPLSPNAIGVGPEGDAYVGDVNRVQRFGEKGEHLATIELVGAGFIEGLLVDGAKDVYAMTSGHPGVHKFDGTGTELGEAREPTANGFNSVLALDGTDDLIVDESEAHHVDVFAPDGVQGARGPEREQPGGETSSGLAFDDADATLYTLYGNVVKLATLPTAEPSPSGEQATEIRPESATLDAVINPEGAETDYHFEYGETAAYVNSTPTAALSPSFEDEPVSQSVSELIPGTEYHFRIVVSSECEPVADPGHQCVVDGPDTVFRALNPVTVRSESVSDVGSESAWLEATLDPNGAETTYHFEYGATASYGTVVPASDAVLGAGEGDVPVRILIEGLTPGTFYHYRVVATNTFGVTHATDATFTTQSSGSTGLIDGRDSEMVSPPDKHGVSLDPLTREGGLIQAAADGDELAYVAKGPPDPEPSGNRSIAETELLATRGASGWTTSDIATPHEAVAGLVAGELSEYRMFSGDLTSGVVEPVGHTPLSPEATEKTPYLRLDDGSYLPLVTASNVPPGTHFGLVEENGRTSTHSGVEFDDASTDLSSVILRAPQALTPGFETGGSEALYNWKDGNLTPISILPDESSAASEGGASLGFKDEETRNAVSAGGQFVFFTTEQGRLYVRDLAIGKSLRIDQPEAGLHPALRQAQFQEASADGSEVLFTDESRLTHDATARVNEPDLYSCALELHAEELKCALKDLTPDASEGEAANVQGAVLGTDEAGSIVYFVANGQLAPKAVNGDCEDTANKSELPSATRSCNLYVYDTETGATTLVAVLSNRDAPDWEAGIFHDSLASLTSRVSPNGRYLAFMSQRSLTGYDNADALTGAADDEVYLYDSSTGRLVCASCDPTGARPHGVLDPSSVEPALLVDEQFDWATQSFAGLIPGWTSTSLSHALYQSRYLSNSGRLFFDSPVGLVPHDNNGQEDVYEFEPDGIGDCGPGASGSTIVYEKELASRPVEGCVGLISSGTSNQESVFLDASGQGPGGSEGEDVFFLTAAKLSPADVDEALDVYDAHVCSDSSPCHTQPPAESSPNCTNPDECRGSVSGAPSVEAASTSTYSGPGNLAPESQHKSAPTRTELRRKLMAKALKECRKDRNRNKRKRCEAEARRRYGASVHKAHKSGHGPDRRTTGGAK